MSHCKASAVSTLGDHRGSVGSSLGQCWVIVRQCWVNHVNDFLQSSSPLPIAGILPLCSPGRCIKFSEPQPNSFVFEMLLFHCIFTTVGHNQPPCLYLHNQPIKLSLSNRRVSALIWSRRMYQFSRTTVQLLRL
jgi:hypothetical protein